MGDAREANLDAIEDRLRAALVAFNAAAKEAADMGLLVQLKVHELQKVGAPFDFPMLSVDILQRR